MSIAHPAHQNYIMCGFLTIGHCPRSIQGSPFFLPPRSSRISFGKVPDFWADGNLMKSKDVHGLFSSHALRFSVLGSRPCLRICSVTFA